MTSSPSRLVGSASVSATGLVVVALMARHVVVVDPPRSGLLLAGFGGLVGLALLVGGYGIYRATFTPRQTLRIAGWNVLGILVIGAAIGLLYAYQAAVAHMPAAPVFSGTVVVAVSAVAHVLIGVNDARRIRATALARERQKLAVLSRLVRHNLRSIAQRLYSHATRIDPDADDAALDAVGDDVHETGERLAAMYDDIQLIQDVVEFDPANAERVDVSAAAEDVVAEARDGAGDASIEAAVSPGVTATAGEYVTDAVAELVDNALEHAGDAPTVTVAVENTGDAASIVVRDDGPGIPEIERNAVLGEREITQLEHASGLGLWLVKWIADAYGGHLSIADSDTGGAAVEIRLPAA